MLSIYILSITNATDKQHTKKKNNLKKLYNCTYKYFIFKTS